jgi:hypothetical protein
MSRPDSRQAVSQPGCVEKGVEDMNLNLPGLRKKTGDQ